MLTVCIVLFLFVFIVCIFFFFKQKTAYEMRISDWSSDVCSSDLRLGGHLNHVWICDHDEAALTNLLADSSEADLVLIMAASATADREDVVPAAIRQAGGRVERVGMPVDPGNLLCLGWLRRRDRTSTRLNSSH